MVFVVIHKYFSQVWSFCINVFCSEFVKVAGQGGKGITPIQTMPVLEHTEAWDGQDGEVIEEDEFSLEDLMSES